MAISQQITHSLKIKKLKGIFDLDEITFDEKPLTAILGPNGCGKSTILHALACCYKPLEDSYEKNWHFREFFTPTTDATWRGSSLEMIHSFRNGATEYINFSTKYGKNINRWTPRYTNRPERHIRFIGIKSCVPRIEEETYTSAISYHTSAHVDAELIKEKMGTVFNRRYSELNTHRAHGGRFYAGLALDTTRYSALAMGAGEQRVLQILQAVFKSPRYGLILIDEIDLLLHTAALKQLVQILYQRAVEKSLQIIFTTHREAVLAFTNMVSIKHIHTIPLETPKTYCFSNTKPDALQRLTGEQQRPLEVFVEDDMAQAIVDHELTHLSMKRIANITPYGSATNCFTLAAGLILSGTHDTQTQLFLLDGDVYTTEESQRTRTNQVLSGTEENANERRQRCMQGIRKLRPQVEAPPAPEPQLHKMICGLPIQEDPSLNEIIDAAKSIQAVEDTHDFVNIILNNLNLQKAVGLSQIVNVASKSPSWNDYVAELREWLTIRKQQHMEIMMPPLQLQAPNN